MKFRPNVNFSFAFEQLKDALKRSEEERAKDTITNFAAAHGILYGAVSGILTFVEEPDDIPADLFQQSEKGRQIDDEIEKELLT